MSSCSAGLVIHPIEFRNERGLYRLTIGDSLGWVFDPAADTCIETACLQIFNATKQLYDDDFPGESEAVQ